MFTSREWQYPKLTEIYKPQQIVVDETQTVLQNLLSVETRNDKPDRMKALKVPLCYEQRVQDESRWQNSVTNNAGADTSTR